MKSVIGIILLLSSNIALVLTFSVGYPAMDFWGRYPPLPVDSAPWVYSPYQGVGGPGLLQPSNSEAQQFNAVAPQPAPSGPDLAQQSIAGVPPNAEAPQLPSSGPYVVQPFNAGEPQPRPAAVAASQFIGDALSSGQTGAPLPPPLK